MAEYKVVERLGVFSEYGSNQTVTKEINIMEWGDHHGPALDIRKWKDGEPGKGVSIKDEELDKFFEILRHAYPDRF